MPTEWTGYKNYNHYYLVNQVDKWLDEIKDSNPKPVEHNRKWYWNIPASFDIETSSYKKGINKYATMYLWSLCINGSTIVGRDWVEFTEIIEIIAKAFHTSDTAIIIYVHNLGYEFQFMKKWFDWDEVFAVKERKPIHATMTNGIEFKCSYILSNYALEYIGDNLLHKYPVVKDVGALDYSKLRHSKSHILPNEIWYNVHDVQIVTSFIQEKLENEGDIYTLPLTNTGYVRQFCREFCFTQMQKDEKLIKKIKAQYKERMKSLKICSVCEYDQLKAAFGGGFTHAGILHSGKICENVGSADEASAYPGVMVRKKFPMGRGTFIGEATVADIDWLTKHDYCAVFTIKLKNVYPKFIYENYISSSHCSVLSKDAVINNGRVVSATELQTVVTEVDFDIIDRCYQWDEIEIHQLRIYPAGYLPKPFILSILKLFGDKTSLKGVKGKETEYMVSKNMINAAYGMSVTSIIRDIFEYSNTEDWLTKDGNKEEQLTTYNNSYNRFLFYGWGVWVTAHARHCLWEAIFEFGEDYIYSDTDSVKGFNFSKHEDWLTLYNLHVEQELKAMCKYWHIPYEFCTPKTIKGVAKTIGVFEIEDSYAKFKTIGAKRYLYEYPDGMINFTVSGVNKKFGMPYLLTNFANPRYADLYRLVYRPNSWEKDLVDQAVKEFKLLYSQGEFNYDYIFNIFDEGLYFPETATGKNTLTYIDKAFTDIIKDEDGVSCAIYELSCIHMEPQSYYMSLAVEYIKYLEGYRDASD